MITQQPVHFVCLQSGRVIDLPPKRPATEVSEGFFMWELARDKCYSNPFNRAREERDGMYR